MDKKQIKLYERKIQEELEALMRLWERYKIDSPNVNTDAWKLARNIELQAQLLGVLGSKLREAWQIEP